jgi:hypothetical protein
MLPVAPPELQVPDSVLLYDPNRDGQFPYIFQVNLHPLAHDRDSFPSGRILVYIQDMSVEGLKALGEFEASLEVPLGTNESVSNLGACMLFNILTSVYNYFFLQGIFEIDHGDLVFIRDMHDPDPENDILGGWVSDW